jgi:hypothetical protein
VPHRLDTPIAHPWHGLNLVIGDSPTLFSSLLGLAELGVDISHSEVAKDLVTGWTNLWISHTSTGAAPWKGSRVGHRGPLESK